MRSMRAMQILQATRRGMAVLILACRLLPAGEAVTPPAEPATPPPGAATAAAEEEELNSLLFDKKGKLNRAAYQRMALDGSAAAIDRRLGPDEAALAKQDGKPGKAVVKPAKPKPAKPGAKGTDKDADSEQIWLPPEQFCKTARHGAGMFYTVGGPPSDKDGDFSSTHAQILYVPDKSGDPGIDRISVLDMASMVFSCRPEPTWWGGTHPEPAVTTPAWLQACGGQLGAPVGVTRAYGCWANSGLMIFTSGLVGGAGTCTSQSVNPFLVLPKGKIPTAISITNKSEFALITVWDVEKLQGQVAVLALESMNKDGLMGLYEWHEQHPGLPSFGGIRTMKLLGFIDLPFATPTAISAVGNRPHGWITLAGKNSFPKDVDLAKQEMRDSFLTGENNDVPDTCGLAVVTSRYENKATFIDLQPLFAFYREMYFTTPENYQRTRDQGPEPKRWPYAFEAEPRARPVVVKTVTVKEPTVVRATVTGGTAARVYIATMEGRLQIWRVGGLATDGPASAGEIVQSGEVRVGRNPSCLVYSKHPAAEAMASEIIVVSRGDREIQWVHFTNGGTAGDSGEITKRLRDPQRLVDPVFAEVADTHGTESYVISVLDFKGRKVVNYRYGPVIYHSNGGKRFDMGPDGKATFECGGMMSFPGFPFALSGTNVN